LILHREWFRGGKSKGINLTDQEKRRGSTNIFRESIRISFWVKKSSMREKGGFGTLEPGDEGQRGFGTEVKTTLLLWGKEGRSSNSSRVGGFGIGREGEVQKHVLSPGTREERGEG